MDNNEFMTLKFYEGFYSERYDRNLVNQSTFSKRKYLKKKIHKDDDNFYEENPFDIFIPKYDW